MALLDMPISEDTPKDMPIEGTLPNLVNVPTDTRNTLTVQAATINSDLKPDTPLFDSFQEISNTSNDVKSTLRGLSAQKAQQEQEDYVSTFKAQPGDTPEDVQENMEAVTDIVMSLDKQGEDEDLMFVKAASQGSLTPETEKRLAVQLRISKMMKEIWDNMDKGDVALDVLSMIVPGNILKDNYDLAGDAFSAEEYMRNFITNFKQLDPDTQLEILPTVKAMLTEDLDSNLKVMNVLDKLITAGSEEDLSEFGPIWSTLDAVDITTLGTATVLKIAKITKALNAPKMLEAANDVDAASDVVAASIADETGNVASAANLDRATTAVNDATGVNLSAIDPAQAGDMSVDTMERINQFGRQVQQVTEDVSGSDLFLKESLLQRTERTAAEQVVIAERREFPGVENIRVSGRQGDVSIISYNVRNPDGSITPIDYHMQLTLDDVAVYQQSTVGLLSEWAGSPSVWGKKNVRQEVDAAIRADSAQAKIFNQLAELNREATSSILGPLGLKGLNPASRKKLAELDHVLRVGDETTTVYTPLELKAGVDGVKLDDKQIEAYYKMRSVIDSLFQLRNNTKREELRIKGMKNINLQVTDETGEVVSEANHIGRPYLTPEAGLGALNTNKPSLVWDESIKQFVRRENLDLAEIYSQRGQVIKFMEPINPPNTGEKVNFAVVYEGVTRLPDNVLHRRVGYIPKINKNVSYFVKEFKATRIDGTDIAATDAGAKVDTLRFFDNRKEAEEWLEGFESENPGVYRVLEDRQLEQERRAGAVDSPGVGGNGLYTGIRSAEDIPFGKDGVPVERVGSFEAIGRNLASVAKYVPRNAWRLGMEQRALNTANKLLPGSNYKSFNQLAEVPDTESGRFIKKMHDQIEEWMGFPTKEEQLWSAMVQGTYDNLVGTKMPGLKGLLYLKHKDPIAAARAAAFHTLLGWFNPVQIWVQAQGASVAVATNLFKPLELARSLKFTQALAAADNTNSVKGMALTAKAFGMTTDELVELKKLWAQTGLRDSILTTADHAASAVGHGIAMDSLSRASNKGLLFYRAGELFNRRLSFVTAMRKWQDKNPGVAIKEDALKDILTGANNLMLGLTRANRAQWQKGVWSVPTQFLQISTKTMETLLGWNGNFTPLERGQILMGQLMLYGAAGIPLGGMGATWLSQSIGYTSQADIEQRLDPKVRKAINEGFEGWASMALFGIDIDVGQRASLASGINQTLDRLLFDDVTLATQFLGAFGSSATRFWRGMTGAFEPLSGGLAETRVITNPLAVVGDLAKTISTWNNASKGLFMHRFDMIVDRHGNPVVRRDFTASEEVARAIGFRPTQEVQAYELRDIIAAKEQLRKDVIDSIVTVFWDYSLKGHNQELTPQYKEETRQRMALLYQSLDTNYERQQAREAVQKRLARGGDLFTKQWKTTRQLWNDGQVDMLIDWHSKLTTRGILQESRPPQEIE